LASTGAFDKSKEAFLAKTTYSRDQRWLQGVLMTQARQPSALLGQLEPGNVIVKTGNIYRLISLAYWAREPNDLAKSARTRSQGRIFDCYPRFNDLDPGAPWERENEPSVLKTARNAFHALMPIIVEKLGLPRYEENIIRGSQRDTLRRRPDQLAIPFPIMGSIDVSVTASTAGV
jgi:hypothetical protein